MFIFIFAENKGSHYGNYLTYFVTVYITVNLLIDQNIILYLLQCSAPNMQVKFETSLESMHVTYFSVFQILINTQVGTNLSWGGGGGRLSL